MALLEMTKHGLYCPAGGFYIDPWGPVDVAVITHAHSDHARGGSRHYLTAQPGHRLLAARLPSGVSIESIGYGERVTRDGVTISLHPAGHILGSAQVRVEHRGEVWVAAGDYKVAADPTCAPFEPVRCDTFITESTFGLPIYRWPGPGEIFDRINAWWRANQAAERVSVLFAYSLGKSQRVLAGVDASIGPIFVHGSVEKFLPLYAAEGVKLPDARRVDEGTQPSAKGRALVIAPASTMGSPWLAKFGGASHASASGWMQLRGARRRQALDRGFVLSDHADWDGLISSIRATGAGRVHVTHGYTTQLARWLNENGIEAHTWETPALAENRQAEEE
ncbi:MAG TPA: ligase-associated DNA damage response exonuclease [Chthoniobacteraceae bacterium]|nr:ligase-associated DNA damage response exonuclease [Chthoniobacteraceae bacterium]